MLSSPPIPRVQSTPAPPLRPSPGGLLVPSLADQIPSSSDFYFIGSLDTTSVPSHDVIHHHLHNSTSRPQHPETGLGLITNLFPITHSTMSRDTGSMLSLFQETNELTPATIQALTLTQNRREFPLIEPKPTTLERNLDRFEDGGQLSEVNREMFKSYSSSNGARLSNFEHPSHHGSSPLSESTCELLNGCSSVADVAPCSKVDSPCSLDRSLPPPHTGPLQLAQNITTSPLLHSTTLGVNELRTDTGGRGTVSPKEAFLDYEYVHTKLEGEALRRASHKKLENSLLFTDSTRPAVLYSRAERLNHDLCRLHHIPDGSPPPRFGPRVVISSPSIALTSAFSKILESSGETAASEFGLPPHCVPKNAIRWTNHSAATASISSPSTRVETLPSIPMSLSLSCSDRTESANSLNRTAIVDAQTKSNTVPTGSQELSLPDLCSSSTLNMLAIRSRDVTPTCEEFSASSSEEASTFESELAIFLGVNQTIEHTLNQDNLAMDNRKSQTISAELEASPLPRCPEPQLDIHQTAAQLQSSRLSSCSDCSRQGSRSSKPSSEPSSLEATIDPVVPTGFYSTSIQNIQIHESSPVLDRGAVKSSDESISFEEVNSLDDPDRPSSQSQSVTLQDSMSVSKTEEITRQDSESKKKRRKLQNSFDTNLTDSITRLNKAPKRCSSLVESSKDLTRVGMKDAEKSHQPVDLNSWIYPAYPRVTRSLLADHSAKHLCSHQSPDNPVRHSMRGSRQSPKHHSEGANSLHVPRRAVGRGAISIPVHSTGPIICGYTDKKTGERCETMFKRPYDLARHKETIHDVEGPEGDRKPQWTCGQCGGGFSRKDALMRHCRIRNHQASGSEI